MDQLLVSTPLIPIIGINSEIPEGIFDFIPVDSQLLTFPPGPAISTMTYQVFLVDDHIPEAEETFRIALNSSSGHVIVSQNTLEVTVLDDDSEWSSHILFLTK